ncbi:hypothetical protein L873DRAFT_1789979 [Choiromyces venosus 120613-1]|uniref:RING-type domain-containing protein n=1 Tax=Choiromyces venosus 120613-1 TaxID=1336337 RepID=A0A3N4JKT4_9PEZI|nr:hypothetical protein L873DRAFT_1789979 [Choiromyces venosus 120613-1]
MAAQYIAREDTDELANVIGRRLIFAGSGRNRALEYGQELLNATPRRPAFGMSGQQTALEFRRELDALQIHASEAPEIGVRSQVPGTSISLSRSPRQPLYQPLYQPLRFPPPQKPPSLDSIKDVDEELECKICLCKEINVQFKECTHGACVTCTLEIWKARAREDYPLPTWFPCPLCRAEIKNLGASTRVSSDEKSGGDGGDGGASLDSQERVAMSGVTSKASGWVCIEEWVKGLAGWRSRTDVSAMYAGLWYIENAMRLVQLEENTLPFYE